MREAVLSLSAPSCLSCLYTSVIAHGGHGAWFKRKASTEQRMPPSVNDSAKPPILALLRVRLRSLGTPHCGSQSSSTKGAIKGPKKNKAAHCLTLPSRPAQEPHAPEHVHREPVSVRPRHDTLLHPAHLHAGRCIHCCTSRDQLLPVATTCYQLWPAVCGVTRPITPPCRSSTAVGGTSASSPASSSPPFKVSEAAIRAVYTRAVWLGRGRF